MLTRRLPPSQVGVASPASAPSTDGVSRVPPGEDLAVALAAPFAPMLTPKQCAAVLRVSTSTLQTWRALGKGPAFVKFSRRTVRYLASSVSVWLSASQGG